MFQHQVDVDSHMPPKTPCHLLLAIYILNGFPAFRAHNTGGDMRYSLIF
jgi:hypothetical protein